MNEFNIPWTASIMTTSGSLVPIENIAQQTVKLEVYTNVDNLFTSVHWIFNASPDLLEYVEQNPLSIGTSVIFDFYPVAEGGLSIKREFKVLSFINGPGMSSSTLGNSYQITLTDPWYFHQTISSRAYRGSVSSIVSELMSSELPDSFPEVRIKESVDAVATRYRTMQKQSEFLKQRLQMVQRGNLDSSSYMFTNTDGGFDLLSYDDMLKLPQFIAIDPSSPEIDKYQNQMKDLLQSGMFFSTFSVILSMNETDNNTLWDLSAPALSYWYRKSLTLKKSNEDPKFRKLGNDGTKKFSFITNKKSLTSVTKVYMDDSLTNENDAYSTILNRYQHDLQEAHHVTIVGYPNLYILAGRLCEYILVRSDNTPSVFRQKYVVRKVTHIFEGTKAKTILDLGSTSFNYVEETDITNLFHSVPA